MKSTESVEEFYARVPKANPLGYQLIMREPDISMYFPELTGSTSPLIADVIFIKFLNYWYW